MLAGSAPLRAVRFTGIADRRLDVGLVQIVLQEIVNAPPASVGSDDREHLIEALLEDLRTTWTAWPREVYLLALTAMKCLGRNPMGCGPLLTDKGLITLLYHSALPYGSSSIHEPSLSQDVASLWLQINSDGRTRPSFGSETSSEALKILANLLLLHESARHRFASLGGALAISGALTPRWTGWDWPDNSSESALAHSARYAERLFLLGRLGFLVTLERPRAVQAAVDTGDIVNSLCHHISALEPEPSSYMALTELLKLTTNLLKTYPSSANSSTARDDDSETLYERFEPLIPVILTHLQLVPTTKLAPPVTQLIQALLFFPFNKHTAHLWSHVPQSPSSHGGAIRSLVSKLGHISVRGSSNTSSSDRTDPTALPARLLRIFEDWCDEAFPYPAEVDMQRADGLVVDEVIPPTLLVLDKCARGSEEMRAWLKGKLLPVDLARSPSAGPLERRNDTLGKLLRFLHSSNHPMTRDSAGELLWSICKGDVAVLSAEIGYGNAAGLLFRKGLAGPPAARIEEIDDSQAEAGPSGGPPRPFVTLSEDSNRSTCLNDDVPTSTEKSTATGTTTSHARLGVHPGERHPITALDAKEGDDPNEALKAMSPEEKEREAERLFVLFNRMQNNPVISAGPSADGQTSGPAKRSMMDTMREKLEKGEVEQWERKDELEDRKRLEEEEKREEEAALRDLAAYKKRTGRT